jgi:hypothetical protein
MALDSLVLAVVFSAIFLYVLYGVIRAAVRDGILQAHARAHDTEDEATSPIRHTSR